MEKTFSLEREQAAGEGERPYEERLRPKNFDEFIGQRKIIHNIAIMVESAKIRKQAMDHCLLSGPPGLGKTSLAMIIAKALGSELHTISGPALEKKGDVAAVLTNLSRGDVLFIDEIHRMAIGPEEILYSAMEDFRLDIMIGQGPTARSVQLNLEPFALVGATTRAGLLSNPLRDRFMAHLHFDFYNTIELAQIVENNAGKLRMPIAEEAREQIARSSRGTPRIANRILRRVRDFVLVDGLARIDAAAVDKALALMDIDGLGLDGMDRKILQVIEDYYRGGPVGIEALCATLAEERTTIEDVYEPYLLKEGLILRTPRGRVNSQKARLHLNLIANTAPR